MDMGKKPVMSDENCREVKELDNKRFGKWCQLYAGHECICLYHVYEANNSA